MKKICILSAGTLPVPPVKGGAVENLIDIVLKKNEKTKDAKFFVTSVYADEAEKKSKEYAETEFFFSKTPVLIKFLDKIIYSAAKIAINQKSNSFRCILARLCYINFAKKLLLSNTFDIVVAENHVSLFLLMKNKKLNQKYENRFFYHAHNEPNGNFTCKKQIESCSKIITVSDFISNCYKKSYPRSNAKYQVVKNGIDVELFSQRLDENERADFRKRIGIKKDDFLVIFAGRLSAEKGIDKLCKAFRKAHIPNSKLMIVGASFFGTKSKNSFQKNLLKILNGYEDRVLFTGFVPYEQMWKYYSISDVAVLPSIWNDPALLTNIEACVCSLPVITTKSGGIPEYSNPESAILLNRNENLVDDIAKNLCELYANPEKRKELGKKNNDFAVQFCKENFYKNYMNVLEV